MLSVEDPSRERKAWESRLRRRAKAIGYRLSKRWRLEGETPEDRFYDLIRKGDGSYCNGQSAPFSLPNLEAWLAEDEECGYRADA